MSGYLIIITGVIYFCVAAEQLALGNVPMFITYLCYSGANAGLWMMATK